MVIEPADHRVHIFKLHILLYDMELHPTVICFVLLYVCEKISSHMKNNKSSKRKGLTICHEYRFHSIFSEDLFSVKKSKRRQISIYSKK